MIGVEQEIHLFLHNTMSSSLSIGAEFFDADDELLSGEQQQAPPLSWRGDPTTTHSDWTIVIEQETCSSNNNEEEKKKKEETRYPVHKAILGVGPRSSTYFVTLFASSNFKEQADGGVSRMTLEPQDAQAFPVLLDYIYEGTLNATTDNAVPLRSLARYLCCQSLLKSVNAFIQQDLSIQTAPSYLVQAWEQSDSKLQTSARLLILQHFTRLDDHALEILPVPLFCSLWKEVKCDNHAMMSRIVYYFFQSQPAARTATLLSELTSPMTHMDVTVVSGFLELVAQLDPQKNKDDSWLALDHLCKKCADSLVTDWRLFDTELCVRKFLNPSVEGDFRGTGRIAVRLMGAGIEQAKADYTRVLETSHQLQVANDRLSLQLQAQEERIASLEESLKHKDLEVAGLQIGMQRKEKRAAAELELSRKRVVELEEQVKRLQEQLSMASVAVAKTPPKKRGGWSS